MEQQQNSQVPPMQQESYGKRLWNLWGPIDNKMGGKFWRDDGRNRNY